VRSTICVDHARRGYASGPATATSILDVIDLTLRAACGGGSAGA